MTNYMATYKGQTFEFEAGDEFHARLVAGQFFGVPAGWYNRIRIEHKILFTDTDGAVYDIGSTLCQHEVMDNLAEDKRVEAIIHLDEFDGADKEEIHARWSNDRVTSMLRSLKKE